MAPTDLLQTKTIVNNESAEILRIFNNRFNALAKQPDLDLFPESLQAQASSH